MFSRGTKAVPVAIGVLLAATLVWAWQLRDENHRLSNQVQELGEKLTMRETYRGTVAEETFHRMGYRLHAMTIMTFGKLKVSGLTTYQSHFNRRLSKCFLEIWFLPTTLPLTGYVTLLDALTGKILASIETIANIQGLTINSLPPICFLQLVTNLRVCCWSTTAFKAFVARYMQ